jgi:cellulose synthase/poly-beta-1,6-N-acetylglucosamine synthase-like glycosyltransferase
MWIETLGAAAALATLPGTLELGALSAAALRAPRPRPAPAADPAPAVVVLVPAHDESIAMLRTLHSLRHDIGGCTRTRLLVVADNCSDDTAAVARAAGVDVLERHDPQRRGKGYALRYAFDRLPDADWFIVVDADTDVVPGFISAMRAAMVPDADALQARYRVRDALCSTRHTLADVALAAWNVVRPRGRAALGLSAGLLGNGFALSRRTLQAVPWAAASIVEDVEYHHALVRAGLRVRWVDGAEVQGDMPTSATSAAQQRARWEGGRLRLAIDRLPALLRELAAGRWRLLEPVADLLLLPLSWHVVLLAAAALLGTGASSALGIAGLTVVALHVAVALHVGQTRREHLRALATVPGYLVWKLGLAAATWRSSHRHAAWVRSQR